MITIRNRYSTLAVILLSLMLVHCDEDSTTGPELPSGCQAQGVYAIAVVDSALTCLPTNAFTDTEEILSAPNFDRTGDGKLEFDGFVSLGVAGSLTVYMGSCIQDQAGADLRVFQAVAGEAIEVQVSANETGPFVSLGIQSCTQSCDFDLDGSGVNNVRVVKVVDQSRTQADVQCDNVGPSPGADVDAVEVLHP
jgi:hypothetical protein